MARHLFEPYPDEKTDPLLFFRELARTLFPKPYTQEPLRLITGVGAHVMIHNGHLSEEDEGWLEGIFRTCAAYKSPPIADDFVLTTLVLGDEIDEDDFLVQDRPATDLLAVCCVPRVGGELAAKLGLASRHACTNESWPQSALEAGTKVVAAAGYTDIEISADHFLYPVGGLVHFSKPQEIITEIDDLPRGQFSLAFRQRPTALGKNTLLL